MGDRQTLPCSPAAPKYWLPVRMGVQPRQSCLELLPADQPVRNLPLGFAAFSSVSSILGLISASEWVFGVELSTGKPVLGKKKCCLQVLLTQKSKQGIISQQKFAKTS